MKTGQALLRHGKRRVAFCAVLADIPWHMIDEVMVVDHGSTDCACEIARTCDATVLNESRRGYGAACLAGVSYVRAKAPDVVVFLDGDFSPDIQFC